MTVIDRELDYALRHYSEQIYAPNEYDSALQYFEEGSLDYIGDTSVFLDAQRQLGTQALRNRILLPPTAALQEVEQITTFTDALASDPDDAENSSVIIGLDAPVGTSASNKRLKRMYRAIAVAREKHPNLDIRTVYIGDVGPNTTIGLLRHNLWAIAATACEDQMADTSNVMFVNCDIDLIGIAAGSLAALDEKRQALAESRLTPPVLLARGKHTVPPSWSRAAKLMILSHTADFTLNTTPGFEAAAAIPLDSYRETKGFNPHARAGELHAYISRNMPWLDVPVIVSDAMFEYNGRRLVAYYASERRDYSDPWGDEFDLSADYRQNPPREDLTEEQYGRCLKDAYESAASQAVLYLMGFSSREGHWPLSPHRMLETRREVHEQIEEIGIYDDLDYFGIPYYTIEDITNLLAERIRGYSARAYDDLPRL